MSHASNRANVRCPVRSAHVTLRGHRIPAAEASMYISKSVLLGLLVAAAGVLGWVLHELTADTRDVADARPAAALRAAEQPSVAGDGGEGDEGDEGDTIVNVIVPAGPGTGTAASPSAAAVTVGTAGTAGTVGAPGTAVGGERSTGTPVIETNRTPGRRTTGARYDRPSSESAARPAAAAAFVPRGRVGRECHAAGAGRVVAHHRSRSGCRRSAGRIRHCRREPHRDRLRRLHRLRRRRRAADREHG